MQYKHFVQFATAMLNEHINSLHDNVNADAVDERIYDRDAALNITSALPYAATFCNDPARLQQIALDIGVYEFIEGWADDEDHYLNSIALNYVQ